MAEWVIAGYPTMELNEADIRRFGPEMNVLCLPQARIPEVLGRHYDISYPGLTIDMARGPRRSPVYAALRDGGAHFVSMAGWERAVHFGAEAAHLPLKFTATAWRDQVGVDVAACRDGAALIDQSAFGKIMVQGPGASFFNRICANQMDVAPGRIVYSQIINTRGGIESDVTVQRHDPET